MIAAVRGMKTVPSLTAPAPQPGVLHVDLKEFLPSRDGSRYVVFAIDEYTRYVFVEFIKNKSEVARAVMRTSSPPSRPLTSKRCVAFFSNLPRSHRSALPSPVTSNRGGAFKRIARACE